MDDAPFMLTFNTYLNVMTFVTVPFVLCICYSDSEAKCKYYWSFVLCETGLSPNVLETTLYSVCRWYEQTNEPKQVLKSHEYDEQPLKNIYNLLSCSCHWNSFVYFVNYQVHLLFFFWHGSSSACFLPPVFPRRLQRKLLVMRILSPTKKKMS